MIAQVDSEASKYIDARYHQPDTGPAEQPGEQRRQRNRVIETYRHDIGPIQTSSFYSFRRQKVLQCWASIMGSRVNGKGDIVHGCGLRQDGFPAQGDGSQCFFPYWLLCAVAHRRYFN